MRVLPVFRIRETPNPEMPKWLSYQDFPKFLDFLPRMDGPQSFHDFVKSNVKCSDPVLKIPES
jgi:hypothetical protein